MQEEIWKQIPGYEGLYEVSSIGRVRAEDRAIKSGKSDKKRVISGGLRTPHKTSKGYFCLGLTASNGIRKQKKVHALVALAFFGERPDGLEVCHADCNKENNHVSNLRYDTPKNNTLDTIRLGRKRYLVGEKNKSSKYSDQEILEIRKFRASGMTITQINKQTGMSKSYIKRLFSKTKNAVRKYTTSEPRSLEVDDDR